MFCFCIILCFVLTCTYYLFNTNTLSLNQFISKEFDWIDIILWWWNNTAFSFSAEKHRYLKGRNEHLIEERFVSNIEFSSLPDFLFRVLNPLSPLCRVHDRQSAESFGHQRFLLGLRCILERLASAGMEQLLLWTIWGKTDPYFFSFSS